MRSLFFFACLFFLPLLQASSFNSESDQLLYDAVYSPEYSNSTILYSFEDGSYPIQVIHNPDEQVLWGDGSKVPICYSLIMVADLPPQLIRHLKEIIVETNDENEDHSIDLKGRFSAEKIKDLAPVEICKKVEDPYFDAQIKECFDSEVFVSKVFYYHLDNKFYRVRIIHNPNEGSFTASKNIKLNYWEPAQSFKITWNHKYGIIIDEEAPLTLVHHLTSLVNTTYWNWYFNFKVCNGTYVKHKEYSHGYNSTTTKTYSIDTWYNFTKNLQ